jgi:hypothetical protein
MKITTARTGLVTGVLALSLAGFTAGCSSSKSSSCKDLKNNVQASVNKMTADESDPSAFVSNAQDIVKQLQSAKVTDPKVKTAVDTFAGDMNQLIADMQKLQGGDSSVSSDLTTVVSKVETDGQTLDTVCS